MQGTHIGMEVFFPGEQLIMTKAYFVLLCEVKNTYVCILRTRNIQFYK